MLKVIIVLLFVLVSGCAGSVEDEPAASREQCLAAADAARDLETCENVGVLACKHQGTGDMFDQLTCEDGDE